MAEIVRSRIKDKGDNDRAAAEILFSLARDEGRYNEYIETTGLGSEEPMKLESIDFEVMLSDEMGTDGATAELRNTLETLFTADRTNNSE